MPEPGVSCQNQGSHARTRAQPGLTLKPAGQLGLHAYVALLDLVYEDLQHGNDLRHLRGYGDVALVPVVKVLEDVLKYGKDRVSM